MSAPEVHEPADGHGSPAQYCRAIEDYVCRKNDGHLIRIVGPAFESVCSWANRGVPLRVAFAGIDRCFERYYAKGSRRRPVRVEFCEADVLDAFDDWRRAIGVPATVAEEGEPEESGRRPGSLPAHIESAIARLTALRGGEDHGLSTLCDAIVRELDIARASVRGVRGQARQALIDRLRELDASLISAARERLDAAAVRDLAAVANAELAPFRDRMPSEAYAQAGQACIDRLIRERMRLPVVAFE